MKTTLANKLFSIEDKISLECSNTQLNNNVMKSNEQTRVKELQYELKLLQDKYKTEKLMRQQLGSMDA